MSQPSKRAVAAAKDMLLGLEAYTKIIDCPAHNIHPATLYIWPHEFAGVWECPVTGESDSCQHTDTIEEIIEVDTTRRGEHDTYETTIDVCELCGITVEVL
jgi:hypothetical protein